MKVIAIICVFTTLIGLNNAQRGSYAGSRPINDGVKGPFPEQSNTLTSRFGEADANGNANQNVVPLPPHFPVNTNHNQYLLNRVNELPINQQPFWYVNREYISDHLNSPRTGGSGVANRGHFMGRRRR